MAPQLSPSGVESNQAVGRHAVSHERRTARRRWYGAWRCSLSEGVVRWIPAPRCVLRGVLVPKPERERDAIDSDRPSMPNVNQDVSRVDVGVSLKEVIPECGSPDLTDLHVLNPHPALSITHPSSLPRKNRVERHVGRPDFSAERHIDARSGRLRTCVGAISVERFRQQQASRPIGRGRWYWSGPRPDGRSTTAGCRWSVGVQRAHAR